jgi:hypothetical protein
MNGDQKEANICKDEEVTGSRNGETDDGFYILNARE